jgi:hypothetical protein
MAEINAQSVLVGTDAKVFLDGEELGTWTECTLEVEYGSEDVYIGRDVDRQITSRTGNGTLNFQATNSMTIKMYNKLMANPFARFTIETELTKLSTGETESATIGGVSFESLPLQNMSKGELVTKELSFRWMPSQSSFTQLIA